jgi:hypothetical protein
MHARSFIHSATQSELLTSLKALSLYAVIQLRVSDISDHFYYIKGQ